MMQSTHFREWNPADIVSLLAGLALALSPWVLDFTTVTAAASNAWIVGSAIALVALFALISFHQAEEWVNGLLGLWAIIAPWALGFDEMRDPTILHLAVGSIVAIVAAATLWSGHDRPHSTA